MTDPTSSDPGVAESPKTAKKRVAKSGRNGNEIPTGNHPKNTGGKKGRSGRPPSLFKTFARDLYNNPKVRSALAATVKDRKGKHFASVHRTLLPFVATTEDAEKIADSLLTVRFVKAKDAPDRDG